MFSVKDFFNKYGRTQEASDLVTLPEEIASINILDLTQFACNNHNIVNSP